MSDQLLEEVLYRGFPRIHYTEEPAYEHWEALLLSELEVWVLKDIVHEHGLSLDKWEIKKDTWVNKANETGREVIESIERFNTSRRLGHVARLRLVTSVEIPERPSPLSEYDFGPVLPDRIEFPEVSLFSFQELEDFVSPTIPLIPWIQPCPTESFRKEVEGLLTVLKDQYNAETKTLDYGAFECLLPIRAALTTQLERIGKRLGVLDSDPSFKSLEKYPNKLKYPLLRFRQSLEAAYFIARLEASDGQLDELSVWLQAVYYRAATDKPMDYLFFKNDPAYKDAPALISPEIELELELMNEDRGVPLPVAKATLYSMLLFEQLREPILRPARRMLPKWQAVEALLHAALTGQSLDADWLDYAVTQLEQEALKRERWQPSDPPGLVFCREWTQFREKNSGTWTETFEAVKQMWKDEGKWIRKDGRPVYGDYDSAISGLKDYRRKGRLEIAE